MTVAEILTEWLGVSPAAGRVAARLYEGGGAVVTYADLMAAAGPTRNGLDLSIGKLRRAMEPGAIANEHGEGFRLTLAGMEDCRAAMRDAQVRALEAACSGGAEAA